MASKKPKPKKRYVLAWIVGISAVVGLLIVAFLTYEILKPETVARQSGEGEITEVCTAEVRQDHGWRWYTRNYPSPDRQWRIFVVGSTLCFGSERKWKGFTIDPKQIEKYGCFETYAGLFCQRGADPMAHPNVADHFG